MAFSNLRNDYTSLFKITKKEYKIEELKYKTERHHS